MILKAHLFYDWGPYCNREPVSSQKTLHVREIKCFDIIMLSVLSSHGKTLSFSSPRGLSEEKQKIFRVSLEKCACNPAKIR